MLRWLCDRARPRYRWRIWGQDTMLRYTASADVGCKIAQLGSRPILGTARKLAESFFETFAAVKKVNEAAAE